MIHLIQKFEARSISSYPQVSLPSLLVAPSLVCQHHRHRHRHICGCQFHHFWMGLPSLHRHRHHHRSCLNISLLIICVGLLDVPKSIPNALVLFFHLQILLELNFPYHHYHQHHRLNQKHLYELLTLFQLLPVLIAHWIYLYFYLGFSPPLICLFTSIITLRPPIFPHLV